MPFYSYYISALISLWGEYWDWQNSTKKLHAMKSVTLLKDMLCQLSSTEDELLVNLSQPAIIT